MKVFISCDIEGVCGATAWDDTKADKTPYALIREQMTREVNAVCEGALEAGAEEILVKDAHDTACNIIPDGLPKKKVKLSRGWAEDAFLMVSGLQYGYDVLLFTGYHAPAHSDGSPLAHTISLQIDELLINGIRMSEFTLNSFMAGMLNIPVSFISGDAEICREAKKFIPGITAVPVSEGRGSSMTSIHPALAVECIKEGVKAALSGSWEACRVPMPGYFDVQIRYVSHSKAVSNSLYPGAKRLDEKTIGFSAGNYMDVMRFFHFVL
jgi:D-amino peptidase